MPNRNANLLIVVIRVLAVLATLFTGCNGGKEPAEPAPAPVPEPETRFSFLSRKQDDVVASRTAGKREIFRVTSPTGISGLEVTLEEGRWPEEIVLELELGNLEGFAVGNGRITLERALKWHKTMIRESASSVRTTDDYVLRIERKDGFIEVGLPPELWAGDVKKISITWIDAYR